MSKRFFRFAFSALLSIAAFCGFAPKSRAAACCGGGFAAPSVISGDEKAQVTSSFSANEIKADVYPDGTWNGRNFRESIETFRLEGAHVFRDRWQAGVSVPVIRRSRSDHSSSGLGDVTGTLGYEYLTDWDYHPWRPKGIGYLQLTFPTGRPIQEADTAFQLDARGRGFWAIGAGTLLVKTFRVWDAHASLDIHRSFDREFSSAAGPGTLSPGWGGGFGIGAGYNLSSFRAGASILWTSEDPVRTTGSVDSPGSAERQATASLTGSWMWHEEWAATVAYSDQTRFGNPINTRLGRIVTFQLQKRWAR